MADRFGFTPAQQMFLRHHPTGAPEDALDVTTWFAGRLHPTGGVEAISRAVAELVRRHEVLRLRLDRYGDTLVQYFGPVPDPDEIVHRREGPDDPLSGDGDRHVPLPPVDVRRGGPLTVLVDEPDADGSPLVRVGLHHLAYDGWSLAAIKRELSAWYAAFLGAASGRPPEPPAAFHPFLPSASDHPVPGRAQLRYWQTHLRDARPWRLPHRTAPTTTGLAVRAVPGHRAGRFTEAARRLGEPPSVLLIGAAVLACAALTGDEEVTLSHLYAGRGAPDAPPVLGPFGLRQIYLRHQVPRQEDLAGFLRRLHATWLGGVLRSEPPYSAPQLFRLLPQGDRFAYLGDSAQVGAGEVVVNVSGSVNRARHGDPVGPAWFGGGGAMATQSSAPVLLDADLGAFEESLRIHWRSDVHSAADVERYVEALGQIVSSLADASADMPVGALVNC